MSNRHKLGDAPIEEQHRDQMRVVAQALDEVFNGAAVGSQRKIGFCLMVYPFGEHATGRCNYISNGADREDVVALMKEMIARFEGQPEMEGRG